MKKKLSIVAAFFTSLRSLAEIIVTEIQNLKSYVYSLPYNHLLEMVLSQQFEVISSQGVVR